MGTGHRRVLRLLFKNSGSFLVALDWLGRGRTGNVNVRYTAAVLKKNVCSSKITLCSCAKNDHCRTRLKCTKNAVPLRLFFGSRRIQNSHGDASDYSKQ